MAPRRGPAQLPVFANNVNRVSFAPSLWSCALKAMQARLCSCAFWSAPPPCNWELPIKRAGRKLTVKSTYITQGKGATWVQDRMTTSPQIQSERITAGRERRQVQQQEREQNDSWKTGVPDLQQQAESSTISQPGKAMPSS
eukprot:1160343-Pelagomonas_calceolata.AAC.4